MVKGATAAGSGRHYQASQGKMQLTFRIGRRGRRR